MSSLFEQLRETRVASGTVAVWSLGQAGYIYQLPSGQSVLIDPYVTDYAGRVLGADFKRLMPALISPEELGRLDIAAYLLTHHHEDHLDADCVRDLASASFPFFAPPDTIRRLKELGVPGDRCHALNAGDIVEVASFTLAAVSADHGELAPDAIGMIVRAEGKAIYHMGDTCYLGTRFRDHCGDVSIDLLLVPINGKFGNMDEREAAEATRLIRPARAAPCHFWMLPANSGGDPLLFVEYVKKLAPDTDPFLFRQGELLIV
ncbi:MBL fold metallo-hydrolase [Cohnella sp.]|uniref:MBL fold metallo-hydrolase n=1 Tax=Cohnella sp. TaxID=1883426 RepID=UPI003569AA32